MDGERIDGLAPHRIAAHGIARTYQNVRLFPDLTAHDNVLVGRHRKVKAAVWEVVARTSRFRREEAQLCAAADELLAFVGILGQCDRITRNHPMAINGGWRSPAHWRPIRGCCSSTSRPPA